MPANSKMSGQSAPHMAEKPGFIERERLGFLFDEILIGFANGALPLAQT